MDLKILEGSTQAGSMDTGMVLSKPKRLIIRLNDSFQNGKM